MPDKHIIDQLLKTLSGLHAEVLLFDENGKSIPAGLEKQIPIFAELGGMAVRDGWTWMRVNAAAVSYICAEGEDQAAADCVRLAAALAESLIAEPMANDRTDVMRAALREELSGPELEALSVEYGIPMHLDRCVLLFHGNPSVIRDFILVGEEDILVEMDRHAIVLVKSMDNMEGYEELAQLAEAMEQTIMSETGEQPIIGIGECRSSLAELGASYRAAWRALEIGRVFKPEASVYCFNRLMLERFLSEIPRELGTRYHHMLFNRKTQRLFNEEMLHTIEMFFEKDLNLSDTARQLYIHRNTLVYRLDKIQRQTGLDLRRFEDAISFRMLLMLGKAGGDRPVNVR